MRFPGPDTDAAVTGLAWGPALLCVDNTALHHYNWADFSLHPVLIGQKRMIKIKKGLDLPMNGKPESTIEEVGLSGTLA